MRNGGVEKHPQLQWFELDRETVAFLILEGWIYAGRPQRLLTPTETAEYVGMSVRALYRGVDEGTFPIEPSRPGSAPRFPWLLVARYAATGVAE